MKTRSCGLDTAWSWHSALLGHGLVVATQLAASCASGAFADHGPLAVLHFALVMGAVWWGVLLLVRSWSFVIQLHVTMIERSGLDAARKKLLAHVAAGVLSVGAMVAASYHFVLLRTKYGDRLGLTLLPTLLLIVLAPLMVRVFAQTQEKLCERLQRRPALARVAGSLVVVAAVLWWVRVTDAYSRVYQAAYVLSSVCLVALSCMGLRLVSRGSRERRGAGRWFISVPFVITSIAVGSLFLPPSEEVMYLLRRDGLTRIALFSVETLDLDGDGFGRQLGHYFGTDCDDDDPGIHPAAREILGNSRDDNCFFGDLEALPEELTPASSSGSEVAATRPVRPLNVLWVTVDSFRLEEEVASVFQAEETPCLASMSHSSRLFRNLRTCSSFTADSIRLMLSGTPHGYHQPARHDTIEYLRDRGYQTIHHSEAWQSTPTPGFVRSTRNGISGRLGFVDDLAISEVAAMIGDGIEEPFFLYMHLTDLHFPHRAVGRCSRGDALRTRYGCLLRKLDDNIRALRTALIETGLMQRTVVVIIGDHGELLGEHGLVGHANSLHDIAVRTPFMVLAPGVEPSISEAPLSCFDVMPTVLDAARIPAPDWFVGRSHLNAAPLRRRHVQWAMLDYKGLKLRSVVVDGFKAVLDIQTGGVVYYDLLEDPGELRPMITLPMQKQLALHAQLDAWLSLIGGR